MKKKSMYLHRTAGGAEPRIRRAYDAKFRASTAYRASMPDMMEAAHDAIHRRTRPSCFLFILEYAR